VGQRFSGCEQTDSKSYCRRLTDAFFGAGDLTFGDAGKCPDLLTSLLLEYFLYLIGRQRYAWIDTAYIVSEYTRNKSRSHNQRDNDGGRNQGKFVS
jgi:hypothetical protein